MTSGSHIRPDKYLGVALADPPPAPSGSSARQVLHAGRAVALWHGLSGVGGCYTIVGVLSLRLSVYCSQS